MRKYLIELMIIIQSGTLMFQTGYLAQARSQDFPEGGSFWQNLPVGLLFSAVLSQ